MIAERISFILVLLMTSVFLTCGGGGGGGGGGSGGEEGGGAAIESSSGDSKTCFVNPAGYASGTMSHSSVTVDLSKASQLFTVKDVKYELVARTEPFFSTGPRLVAYTLSHSRTFTVRDNSGEVGNVVVNYDPSIHVLNVDFSQIASRYPGKALDFNIDISPFFDAESGHLDIDCRTP
ncbi:MAG: hypothetical protein HYY62_00785 [Deltaproteobacteria bacterium]|nr:hypothetical protein [Deltaproteobacteria bacterium]